jgi:hypothetical protein
MKKHLSLLSYALLAITIIFASCKPEDDPTPEEQALKDLSFTWNLTTATPAGGDPVTLSGVSITFNGDGTYAVSGLSVLNDNNLNNDDAFAESGTFEISSVGENGEITASIDNTTFTATLNGDALALLYQAAYPKATDNAVAITITGAKQ